MSPYDQNPFPEADKDRHALWEMLVRRDIDAFLAADWNAVAEDFVEENFMGIDGRFLSNPDSWHLGFPDLNTYKTVWLDQAAEFKKQEFTTDIRTALFLTTTLRDIQIEGDSALLHKKFDGRIGVEGGTVLDLKWQTLYRCRKLEGKWKIAGFVGYLHNPLGEQEITRPAKTLPPSASQHSTAGPYSPVLEIDPGKLVVISGQGPIDSQGQVIGESIEEQTKLTLENCQHQLASAGCSLADVFKVNVFLTNLDEWSRFNEVYREFMPEPRPVRTAVQTGLLMTFKVEIEMWAVKRA